MRVADLLQTDPEYVLSGQSCRAAARRMRDRGIDFLPVCDADRRVVGAVSDRDLAIGLVGGWRDGDLPVREVMSREVVACGADDDVRGAGRAMAASRKARLVVLDREGRLAGVVTLEQVARRDPAGAAAALARLSREDAR